MFNLIIQLTEKIYQIGIDNKKKYDKDSIDQIRLKILKYVTELAIKIKTGQSLTVWANSEEMTQSIYLTSSGIWGDRIIGYQFVDLYLSTGYLNEDMCKKTINNYLAEEKKRRQEKTKNDEILKLSYHKVQQWWKLEDNEIHELLKKVVYELDEMKYPPMYFKEIILIWVHLTLNEFNDIPCEDELISPMKTYIENEKVDNLNFIKIRIDDINFQMRYDNAVSKLREAIEVNISTSKSIVHDASDWFKESFYGWCSAEHNNFLRMRQFISLVKSEEIISVLEASNTEECYNFLDGLNSVYSFSNLNDFFRSDLQTIDEILDHLNKEDFSNGSITKGIAIKKVKAKLEEVKTILKK